MKPSFFLPGTLLLSLLPPAGLACQPAFNPHPPTLQDNFRRAETVAFGLVEKKDVREDKSFKIRMRIKRTWKGTARGHITISAGPGSTCDGFGPSAAEGAGCVLFLDADRRALSGASSGESSFCLPAGSPRAKTLAAEYDARFRAKDAEH